MVLAPELRVASRSPRALFPLPRARVAIRKSKSTPGTSSVDVKSERASDWMRRRAEES